MRFFFAAILFLLAVAIFTIVAKVVYQSSVEGELEEMAEVALAEGGYDEVEVEFDHHQAKVTGFVDDEEGKGKVIGIIRDAIPFSILPSEEEAGLKIRPTIPPRILITKKVKETLVKLEGVIGSSEEGSRSLFGSKIHALEGIESVENLIELDPKRLPFPNAAELASLAAGLIEHSNEAVVRLENGVLAISGEVPNEGIKAGLLELATQVGAGSFEEAINVTPPATFFSPSTLSVTRNRFGVQVSGNLNSAEEKERILAALQEANPDGRVTDRIEFSDAIGEAPWQQFIDSLIPLLIESFLGEMTVEFGERQIRLSGEVGDEDKKSELLAAFQSVRDVSEGLEILSDIKLDESKSSAGPEVRVLASFEGGLLSLIGNVPDDSFVASLEATFQEREPVVLIKNSLEVTPSSPGKWAGKLGDILEELPYRVEAAVLVIADGKLKMEGRTLEPADKQLLQNLAVNVVPSEFSIENLLIHADQPFPMPELLPEARIKLAENLKRFPIYFDTNSEEINRNAKEVLESIFSLLKESGAQTDLLVTGFADNVGNAEYNRQLSLRRAEAVVKELVAQGVDESRIEKLSKGEDVSRVARSERWKARRVEVSLAPVEGDSSSQ